MKAKSKRQQKQVPVTMYLPQSEGLPMDRLYENFKRRVGRKSRERNDLKKNPTQLILQFPLLDNTLQMGVIVVKDSFLIQSELDEKNRLQEIGFQAQIESPLSGTYMLYVLKRGKAYLEKA